MARTGNRSTTQSTTTRVEPYFKRLTPSMTDRVTDDATSEPLVEVRVFDDSKDVGQRHPGIVAQFFSMYSDKDTGKPRVGKGFSITSSDAGALRDLSDLLADAADVIERGQSKAAKGRKAVKA